MNHGTIYAADYSDFQLDAILGSSFDDGDEWGILPDEDYLVCFDDDECAALGLDN